MTLHPPFLFPEDGPGRMRRCSPAVLVLFLLQLKKTVREGEKALEDIRTLTNNLNETSIKVNTKIEDMGEVLEAAKKTAVNTSDRRTTRGLSISTVCISGIISR